MASKNGDSPFFRKTTTTVVSGTTINISTLASGLPLRFLSVTANKMPLNAVHKIAINVPVPQFDMATSGPFDLNVEHLISDEKTYFIYNVFLTAGGIDTIFDLQGHI